MKKHLDPLGYDNINLLSCMTLGVVFPICARLWKHSKRSIKMHSCDFMVCLYHTNCGSWCRVPESTIPLPPAIKATKDEISKMQDWASAHGSMRQRSVRQEITMARAGTRPDYLYQKEVQVGEKVSFRLTSNATNRDMPHEDEPEKNTVEDEVSEFDSSSD